MPEKFKQLEKELENLKSEILNLNRTIKLYQHDNEKIKTEKEALEKDLKEKDEIIEILETNDKAKELKVTTYSCYLCDCENPTRKDFLTNVQSIHNQTKTAEENVEKYTKEIRVLKEEVKHIKGLNSNYQNETNVIKINVENDKIKFTELIKAKNSDTEKIKLTHDILKDLYEKQHNKYYALLETKEMLEASLETKQKELKAKNMIREKCDDCGELSKTNSSLKKHTIQEIPPYTKVEKLTK